jgi:hypothetical protein
MWQKILSNLIYLKETKVEITILDYILFHVINT